MQKTLTIKIASIIIITLFLMIVIQSLKSTITDRQYYRDQALDSVAQSTTGKQTLISPALLFQAQNESLKHETGQNNQPSENNKHILLFPEQLKTELKVVNKEIYKGIYKIPVYQTQLKLWGMLSKAQLQQFLASQTELTSTEAYLAFHISDVRGLNKQTELIINGKKIRLELGSQLENLESGLHAKLPINIDQVEEIHFNFSTELKGMQSLSFIQIADDAQLNMQSNWPHPSFTGSSLPDERNISADGFQAVWRATRFSNQGNEALKTCVNKGRCYELEGAASTVEFIEPINVYLQSERSVKYALLFIALSFIIFFIFEHSKRCPIHPIQYAFVGLAISVFYLLLLALSEHFSFIHAYSIALACCASLIGFYLRYMLKSAVAAGIFTLMLIGLYALLFVIIQAEDFAMLLGAGLIFTILTILMYVTKDIDWYQMGKTHK